MSPLLAFYRHQAPDHRGRWLAEIWRQNTGWLAQQHDVMPWLFPLPDSSQQHPMAPHLDEDSRQTFSREPALQLTLQHTLYFTLAGMGIEPLAGEWRGVGTATADWLHDQHPHQRRLTRIVRCLFACGALGDAITLQAFLLQQGHHRVNPKTLEYWRQAGNGLPPC